MSDHSLQRPDMESSHEFGCSVDALSHLSGLPSEIVALQLTCVLTGVGGPNASVVSMAKEVHPAHLNLIIAGGSDPRQTRLTELLLSPIRHLQEDLCNYSELVSDESLEKLSKTYRRTNPTLHTSHHEFDTAEEEAVGDIELHNLIETAENSVDATPASGPWQKLENYQRWNNDKAGSSFYGYEARATVLDRARVRSLRQPLILMENLPPGVIVDQIKKVDRLSPFVVDGDGALVAAVGRSESVCSKIVQSLLSGRLLNETEGDSCSSVEMGKGSLLSVVSSEGISELSKSKLGTSVFRDSMLQEMPEGEAASKKLTAEEVEVGYETYRRSVKDIVRLRRRDLLGICLTLADDDALHFFEELQKFSNEILEVEEDLRMYAAKFISLPASILWMLQKSDQSLQLSALIPASFYLARNAMHQHLVAVKTVTDNEQSRINQDREEVMIKKLQKFAPCTFRELVRKFADQKKEIHQPVLNQLIESGKVIRLDSGELDISEQVCAVSG